MPAAYHVALEMEIPAVRALDRGGRFVGRNIQRLDAAATAGRWMPLSRLIGASETDAAEFLDWDPLELEALSTVTDGVGPSDADYGETEESWGEEVWGVDDDGPPQQWFSAALGLATVRGLLAVVQSSPAEFEAADELLAELAEMERVLVAAEAGGVRFRLNVD